MKDFAERVKKIRQKIAGLKLDALLVSKIENIRYLTGFSGSTAFVVIDGSAQTIFVDFRYIEQVKKETKGYAIVQTGRSQVKDICEFMKTNKYKKVGFEADSTSVTKLAAFETNLPAKLEMKPTSGLIEELRIIKSKAEIKEIQNAVDLVDATFLEIVRTGKKSIIGKSESAVAAQLEYLMKLGGAQSPSFESIVAFGTNSSCPHYKPVPSCIVKAKGPKVGQGTFLKMDFGAKLNGYCSDMTRTIFIGKPSQKLIDIYKIVLEAQLAAIAGIRPGMKAMEVDKIARDVIAKYGHADKFGHGLGHGVGLEIHEAPSVSTEGQSIIAEGMVFTVEPGIYIPGTGGVRIEDIILVTKTGCRILTKSSKEVIIL